MSTLFLGDCLDIMRKMDADSIDSIVTDPPYGLNFMGKDFDNPKMMGQAIVMHGGLQRYPKGEKRTGYANCDMLMFQEYMTPIFAEALRVSKPGAHLLAFGGTRTYHRLACAIEDAGWEVRDCIMWVYGSGFPKSMDVAKAIDKASGYEGEVISSRIVDVGMQGGNMHAGRSSNLKEVSVRAASAAAQPWQGWGTCLKPACEPIVVARKPLEGTVVANVLKYGTGAINIDGCRVPTEEAVVVHSPARKTLLDSGHKDLGTWENTKGRFPANLIHDGSDEVLALFPQSNGGAFPSHSNIPTGKHYEGGWGNVNNGKRIEMGTGSAARFFYCAKASRKERDGSDHPTMKPLALMRYLVRLVTRKGGRVLDPFMGSGTTGVAAVQEGMRFVGIEKDEHYYDIARFRVTKAKPTTSTTQQELPL